MLHSLSACVCALSGHCQELIVQATASGEPTSLSPGAELSRIACWPRITTRQRLCLSGRSKSHVDQLIACVLQFMNHEPIALHIWLAWHVIGSSCALVMAVTLTACCCIWLLSSSTSHVARFATFLRFEICDLNLTWHVATWPQSIRASAAAGAVGRSRAQRVCCCGCAAP